MELLDDFACPEPIVIQPIALPVISQADEKTNAGSKQDETETCSGNAAETNESFMLGCKYKLSFYSKFTTV